MSSEGKGTIPLGRGEIYVTLILSDTDEISYPQTIKRQSDN